MTAQTENVQALHYRSPCGVQVSKGASQEHVRLHLTHLVSRPNDPGTLPANHVTSPAGAMGVLRHGLGTPMVSLLVGKHSVGGDILITRCIMPVIFLTIVTGCEAISMARGQPYPIASLDVVLGLVDLALDLGLLVGHGHRL